jgi:succinyl-diaminopimelate desuccinylase
LTANASPIDPVALAQALIRRPSVTPADEGALETLAAALRPLGFACHRLRFESDDSPAIDNLYAVAGTGGRNFCFAGHTDVVPPGNRAAWRIDPFAGAVENGMLHGRGAADMKGAIACFAAAAARFLARHGDGFGGRISLLITGDEEGPSINGTRRVLDWLRDKAETLDACVVGEPTNPTRLGEMVKIGRRGSLNGRLTVTGVQGHIAYPQLADNPIHRLLDMLAALRAMPLDQGTPHFQPSSLQFFTIDVGNPTTNLIPAEARAGFNIRFNDQHTAASLERWLRQRLDAVGGAYRLDIAVSREAFLTAPGPLSSLISDAVRERLGIEPELSTSGGASDACFIRAHCPVAEFGLVGQTMHKVDERTSLADLAALTEIYDLILERYFAA